MNFKSVIAVGLFMATAASASEVAKPTDSAKVIQIREVPADFRLPPQLWDALLRHSTVKEVKASIEGQEDEVQASTVLFASLKVRFHEKNKGVLINPVVELVLPKGGGQIDLSTVTTGEPGTFFVEFVLDDASLDPTFEAYHLSKTKKRKVEGRIYGGGCQNFAKITSIIKSSQDGRGLPFNTTRDLHISSLGGHFIFSKGQGEQITITQVRFFDSNKPQYACETNTESESE